MTVVLHRIGEDPLNNFAELPVELIRAVAAGAGQLSLMTASVFSKSGDSEIDTSYPFEPSPELDYTPQPSLYE